jgi:TubC N-terminal docking domain
MTLDELVAELRDKDVRIFDEGSTFRLQAPKGVLTPQLLEVFTSYQGELLYLVRMGDVRVCPERTEHRPQWRYSSAARMFICCVCRHEVAA